MTQAAEARTPARVPLALEALILPDAGMARVAKVGRIRGPLLFAMLASILLGGALAVRVDAREVTLKQLEMQGKLASMSDRQIEDAQKSSERIFMVKKVAVGIFEAPFGLLLGGVGLLLLSWFLRGRSKASEVFTVAAYGLLPGAIATLVEAGATWLRPMVSPEGQASVPRTLAALAAAFGHPVIGAAAKVLGAFDVFDLWGAAMMAFGLATAAQLPVRRAVVGTLVAWICYRLVRFVALGA